MRGAKCDAAECGEFERGGSAGALTINMENLPPTQRRPLAIQLYQAGVLEMDDKEFMDMANGEAMPRMGRVHVDLCKGHVLTALTEYGILDSPDEQEQQTLDATDIEAEAE